MSAPGADSSDEDERSVGLSFGVARAHLRQSLDNLWTAASDGDLERVKQLIEADGALR